MQGYEKLASTFACLTEAVDRLTAATERSTEAVSQIIEHCDKERERLSHAESKKSSDPQEAEG